LQFSGAANSKRRCPSKRNERDAANARCCTAVGNRLAQKPENQPDRDCLEMGARCLGEMESINLLRLFWLSSALNNQCGR
jgi:hypothetical protein